MDLKVKEVEKKWKKAPREEICVGGFGLLLSLSTLVCLLVQRRRARKDYVI